MRLLKQLQDQRITDFDTVYPLLQSVMDRRRQNHLAAARFGRGCDLSGSKQAKPDADGPVDGAKVILNLPRPTGRNGESPWHVDFTKKSDSSATDCQGLRFCVHQRHQMMTSKMLEELQENLSKSFKITLQKLGNHIRAHDEGNPRVILREPLPRSLSSPFHCSGRHTDADKEGCQGRSQLRSEEYVSSSFIRFSALISPFFTLKR